MKPRLKIWAISGATVASITTPRPLIRAIVAVIVPRLGETVCARRRLDRLPLRIFIKNNSFMQRIVKPEILDQLDPDDPAVLHNRRDLKLFNRLMGNNRWMHRKLSDIINREDSVLELGAGVGDFGLYLNKNRTPSCFKYAGLDLLPRPVQWPVDWAWHQADLTKFSGYCNYTVLCGIFILHQFEDAVLQKLFQSALPHLRVLIFCETARRMLHRIQLPWSNFLGINYVSRHDARVSIESGFYGHELQELLCLEPNEWAIETTMTFLGAYRFVAVRKG